MRSQNLHFNLPVTILREGQRYVAYTPALDLSTSGRSFKQAKQRFDELVHIFINELVKHNTLNQVLSDQGWQRIEDRWQAPVIVAQDTVCITA